MKTLFTILIFSVFFINAQAQKFQIPVNQDSLIYYSGVVKLDTSISSKVLYGLAKAWFADTFNSAKSVIESDDELNGVIIGKGYTQITVAANLSLSGLIGQNCYFTVKVEVKDNRFRYSFYNFYTADETITNDRYQSKLTPIYIKYLRSDYSGNLIVSKKRMDTNFYNAFASINAKITAMISSMKNYLSGTKSAAF